MKIRAAARALLQGWLPAVLYLFVMLGASTDSEAVLFVISYTAIVAAVLFVILLAAGYLDRRQVHPASLVVPPGVAFPIAIMQFQASTRGIDVGISFTTLALYSLWGAIFGLVSALAFRYKVRKIMKAQEAHP